MKKALVLAGGGTKGIYQLGAIEALRDLGQDDWSIITGTSVGSLNAIMLVQHDFQAMVDMYEHLQPDQIVNGYVPNAEDMNVISLIRERENVIPSFKAWYHDHGVDIAPFRDMVHKYFDADRFFNSEIEFGCIAATAKGHDPVYVTKEVMKEHPEDWLVASASAYPIFPVKEIEGKEYVDGGYFDNLPVDFALRLGAQRVIAIDLDDDVYHPNFKGKENIAYIHPHAPLFTFLDFNREKMETARVYGYNDVMKIFGIYYGERFTFYPFHRPAWFEDWYRDILMLETKIKIANELNERVRSHQVITDILKNQLHCDHLKPRQYLYGMMDALMECAGCEEKRVFTYLTARNEILACFSEAASEDFPRMQSLDVKEIASFLSTLDRKNVIKKMVHSMLYPDHAFIPESLILTVYPFEYMLAKTVVRMMIELGKE